MTWYLLLGSGC